MGEHAAPEQIRLHPQWQEALRAEFSHDYMKHLRDFLLAEKHAGKIIVPKGDEIFAALNLTPLKDVKVVIVGQDPYHGPGQAHGLSFSVKPGVPPPPSLINIYKELQSDLGIPPAGHGHLQSWSRQGVLLLNAILSVEQGKAASHQNRGWERFTSKVLEVLATQQRNLVFILWGAYAQHKGAAIDRSSHLVLAAPHPSPLSSYRGFFGSRPFSQTNSYLISKGKSPISWELPAPGRDEI